MQPIRLTIYGDIWDSYLYRGRLYLWDMSNDLHVYRWDEFVEDINSDHDLALTCAFVRGDALYRHHTLDMIFRDPRVAQVITTRFADGANTPIERNLADLEPYRISSQQNPANDHAADLTIYRSTLYQLTEHGVMESSVHRPWLRHGVSTKAHKRSDLQGLSVEAAHRSLAIAAGSDGFFELKDDATDTVQLGQRHTTFVRWLYASIFASSDTDGGELAAFSWQSIPSDTAKPRWKRQLTSLFSDEEIGKLSGGQEQPIQFSWGSRDKIYLLSGNQLRVVSFQQTSTSEHHPSPSFRSIGTTVSLPTTERPIEGIGAAFGVVLEYATHVTALLSNGELYSFDEPVVRWRIFPRSIRYENQLHLIGDDRLIIESFNHDYAVDQDDKIIGSKVKLADLNKPDF